MSLSKQYISTPLEAGRSILDTHNLPPHLTGALEYTSKRLARKALHITLVVVRNDYQLPSSAPPCATPTSPPTAPEYRAGLASPRFASPMVGLRQLVRRGTNSSLSSTASETSTSISSLSSPTFSPPPSEPLTSPRRWVVPLTPGSPAPWTPMTPNTPFSVTTTATTTSATSSASSSSSSISQSQRNSFGIRLLYTSPLSPKAERTLRSAIAKAERKFQAGAPSWLLPPVITAGACGLNQDLVHRSILQNEVLFSSEGLTLLGLDRLYTFKAALAAYSRSISCASPAASPPPVALPNPLSSHPVNFAPRDVRGDNGGINSITTARLEEAVDSLRRLILLANSGRPVAKGDLYRSYDWLGVNPRALSDVERMYRRGYGGLERRGPFEVTTAAVSVAEGGPQEGEVKKMMKREGVAQAAGPVGRPVFKIGPPPPPKTPPRAQTTPVLKLNTNIPSVATIKKAVSDTRLVRPKPNSTAGFKPRVDGEPSDIGEQRDKIRDVDLDNSRPVHRQCRHQQETQGYKSPHPGVEVDIGDLGLDLEIRIVADGYNDRDHHTGGNRIAHPHARLQGNNPLLLPGVAANELSIDELMLSPCDDDRDSRHRLGPATPNGYDDISPVTRGEWGFLFQGLGAGRTVTVERC